MASSTTLGIRYHSAMEKLSLELPPPAIDGPWRADAYGAKLVPARNGGGVEEIRLIDHRALAVYGAFGNPALRELLRYSLGQLQRQSASIVPLVFDRFGVIQDEAASEVQSLESALRDLIGYGEAYAELLRAAKLLWSVNGKYLVPLISLTADELSDPTIRGLLGELFELTQGTPLRPVLIAENPRRMPPELQQILSWQGYLGADQVTYARDRYAMAAVPGIASRIPIGVSVDREAGESRTLNSFTYEPTADARNRREAVAAEAAIYERFLEGLTDGS